jgi:hypothetical protein
VKRIPDAAVTVAVLLLKEEMPVTFQIIIWWHAREMIESVSG